MREPTTLESQEAMLRRRMQRYKLTKGLSESEIKRRVNRAVK